MAVGFNPKHVMDFPLNGLSPEEFLVLAIETATMLKWDINYISRTGIIAYTNNGMFSWNGEITIKIEEHSANLKSASTGSEMADWGKNKRVIEDFITVFGRAKEQLSKEELHRRYDAMQSHLTDGEADLLQAPPPTTKNNVKDFFSIFIPVKDFFITPLIIDLNILVFILMILTGVHFFEPATGDLLSWGANFRPVTMEGEWWRLLTAAFIHIGILHLALNMYALLYIGILLEPLLGWRRYITAYLLTAITGSVVSLWWHDFTVSAGASGAIFGMYGVFLALLTTKLIEASARKALLGSIGVFVAYNLIFGLQLGVDNAGHIGGLIGGILVGYAYVPSLKKHDDKKNETITIVVTTMLILVISFFICSNTPNDFGVYQKKMEEFSAREAEALDVYSIPDSIPRDSVLSKIKNKGINNWKANIKLLESTEALNIPLEFKGQNRLLKEYCELRVKAYELMYMAVWSESGEHQDSIDFYNRKIEEKLNVLNGKEKIK